MPTIMATKIAKSCATALFSVSLLIGTMTTDAEEISGPKMDSVTSLNLGRPERQTKANTALPTKRYNLQVDLSQITYNLEPLDPKSIESKAPNQIGMTRPVQILSDLDGTAFKNPDGSEVIVLAVKSPGAVATRVHFEDFDLSSGDEVYVYGLSSDSSVAGPYTGKGLWNDKEFWSKTVEGDTAIIEYHRKGSLGSFRISEIVHIYGTDQAQQATISPNASDCNYNGVPLSCEIDASCYTNSEKNAVARITYIDSGGSYLCTGTLLVDRNSPHSPYFLTANHCVSSETIARTVEAYWFYQTSGCNSGVLGSNWVSTQGANLAVSDATKDFALLLGPPTPSGAVFSGWDANAVSLNTSVFGFHHPGAGYPVTNSSYPSYLRRADGYVSSTTSLCSASGLLNAYAINWTSGLTEPGSSGSGLWDVDGNGKAHLVGVDSCGPCPPTCLNPSAIYSKFSDFFPQIQPLIYPQNTLTVASSNPNSGVAITASPSDDSVIGNGITQFVRKYAPNKLVALTAPTTVFGNSFAKWQRDGADYSSSNSVNVTMDTNHTMTAVYGTAPPPSLDVINTNSSGSGSLLAALTVANSTPSVKTITFHLPGSGPWTITTSTTLLITAPVLIDGSSQPGDDGQFNRVYVEGAPGVSNVFSLSNHGGTTLKGLGIYNYDNDGVEIESSASWNFVDDCYIGFKGTLHNTSRAPSCTGVEILGSYNKVRRTTISGVYNGISIGEPIDQPTGLVSHDNLFEYNRIGTDPTGQTTVGYGNTSTGIFLGAGVQSSWIGGYNVIAGNGGSAVEIRHPSDFGNRIYYNYLGVNDGGTQIIAGSTNNQGILIGNDAKNNGAWGNVIAGNRIAGIIVASGDGNWILGNTVGLNQSQTQAIGSQPSGIVLKIDDERSPGVAAVRNPITGNMVCNHILNGIGIYDNAEGNGVYNNWIGMNSVGQFFANTNFGVYLENSSYNTVGGNVWGANGQGNVGQVGGTGNIIY